MMVKLRDNNTFSIYHAFTNDIDRLYEYPANALIINTENGEQSLFQVYKTEDETTLRPLEISPENLAYLGSKTHISKYDLSARGIVLYAGADFAYAEFEARMRAQALTEHLTSDLNNNT